MTVHDLSTASLLGLVGGDGGGIDNNGGTMTFTSGHLSGNHAVGALGCSGAWAAACTTTAAR